MTVKVSSKEYYNRSLSLSSKGFQLFQYFLFFGHAAEQGVNMVPLLVKLLAYIYVVQDGYCTRYQLY
jgi:hypothetical protein